MGVGTTVDFSVKCGSYLNLCIQNVHMYAGDLDGLGL